MLAVTLSMTLAKRWKFMTFEIRLRLHYFGFASLFVSMCFHTPRCRIITLIFCISWAADYFYTFFFRTYRLDVVEFFPLSGKSGTQMLFRKPKNFHAKSGEYIQICLPWLPKGGNEWHPFSVYLREATREGIDNSHHVMAGILHEEGDSSSMISNTRTLEDFVKNIVYNQDEHWFDEDGAGPGELLEEAREDLLERYSTTQVFIAPSGDWTRGVCETVGKQRRQGACWIRGPFTSPFHVANRFTHLLLMASGKALSLVFRHFHPTRVYFVSHPHSLNDGHSSQALASLLC
mmetsp:Transcript_20553/g.30111  ORF Transcript_20553/g.30111 Transcript_20553/m.30111 type:complete len:290 (+) Transcript_20553:2-871(+)